MLRCVCVLLLLYQIYAEKKINFLNLKFAKRKKDQFISINYTSIAKIDEKKINLLVLTILVLLK